MEHADYVNEIMNSVIENDTLRFHNVLLDLKKEDTFEGALMLAQGFAYSNRRHYEKFVYYALCENPDWGTVMREGYGQPLVRQFFRSGAMECLSKFLDDMETSLKEILPQVIKDAKNWHKETLDQLEALPEHLPICLLKGEKMNAYYIGERDFEEIMPIIMNHDIAVRQSLMLEELSARL